MELTQREYEKHLWTPYDILEVKPDAEMSEKQMRRKVNQLQGHPATWLDNNQLDLIMDAKLELINRN